MTEAPKINPSRRGVYLRISRAFISPAFLFLVAVGDNPHYTSLLASFCGQGMYLLIIQRPIIKKVFKLPAESRRAQFWVHCCSYCLSTIDPIL